MNTIPFRKGICYSGYRSGQSPVIGVYPTYEQVKEDLIILEKDFTYIRLYDATEHAETTLEVIKNEKLNLQVMLGINLLGEISNPNCAWGGEYSVDELSQNIIYNQQQLYRVIELANEYEEIVLGVSAGNESTPEWNENLVSPSRVLYFVKELKKHTNVPITYCDNVYYWHTVLTEIAHEVDFISIHIYPVWHGMPVHQAITTFIHDYNSVKQFYPNKQIMITETGWPTNANGGQIPQDLANEINQLFYNKEIDRWSEQNNVICFFFEAFDEHWKGSENEDEPEKHWGYYYENRRPKLIKTTNKNKSAQ